MTARLPGPEASRPVAGRSQHRSGRVRRVVLLLGLAGVCSWRLLDSAAVGLAFHAETGLERRVELLTLDDQGRARRTLGKAAELLEPLRARVPPHGTVLLSRRVPGLSPPAQARLMLLRHQFAVLLFPDEVLAIAGPLTDPAAMAYFVERDTWLADLSPELPVPAPFELVLELEGYRIWSWQGAAR